ncbi:MAG: ATP-dependent Clp protease ATP-binding subunit ClpC [Gaiellales bacterium]|nr:ATP-dependent Clp protease ATP-binding subunit ClpC [Gaiellales bacterium]
MFERFTERARQVVVFAQDEARALQHASIGTEHILLGLLREEAGLAARALASFGLTVEAVRAQVVIVVGRGEEPAPSAMPFTPVAKRVLELALREALSLGHNYIGTEHILLGLVREDEGAATRVLLDLDLDAATIRREIVRRLEGPGRHASRTGGQATTGEMLLTRAGEQALELAAEEARALGHNYVGTEHFVLGLLRERQGLAAQLLIALGITRAEVRTRVIAYVGEGDEVTTGELVVTPRAQRVLELARREARSRGRNAVGTEDILLGLIREEDGIAARILRDFRT